MPAAEQPQHGMLQLAVGFIGSGNEVSTHLFPDKIASLALR
jgi:hypothetical protein